MSLSHATRSLLAWLALAAFLLTSAAAWGHAHEHLDEPSGSCGVCRVVQHSPAVLQAQTQVELAPEPLPWQASASVESSRAGHSTAAAARGPPIRF